MPIKNLEDLGPLPDEPVDPRILAQLKRDAQAALEELAESIRRTRAGIDTLEDHLARNKWMAGDEYSLGDVNGFNLGYALPLSQPDYCNDERTPHIMAWLRAIYARPATKETWAKGKTDMASRVGFLEGGES